MPFDRFRTYAATQQGFARLSILLVSLGFAALIAAAVAAALLARQNERDVGWVQHTRQVEAAIYEMAFVVERAETAHRGFLVDPQSGYRTLYQQSVVQIPVMAERIAQLTQDNPRQQRRMAALRPIIDTQRKLLDRSIRIAASDDEARALAEFRSGLSTSYTRRIRAVAQEMAREEGLLLSQRQAAQTRTIRAFYLILGGAGLLILLIGFASIWIISRYTRDLGRSRDQLRGLNENLEGAVRERTTDLQRANDEIQRFAYIVSHDLRSPLVNVMGFTAELEAARKPISAFVDTVAERHPELVGQDVRAAAQEDLPEAIGFIRSSTQRMDRLINAILSLSRQGRRTIAPEPIDTAALLEGVAAALHHRVTELGAEIRIEAPLPDVVSDRLSLDQIFSNLVENAVKYLQPGRPGLVVVRGRQERGRALFEVIDNGRGIDPRDHERVFDLFRRSGAQDQPGEGIGLAHVRALAYRLGGTIECDSALDRGATFRLSLPLTYQGEGISSL